MKTNSTSLKIANHRLPALGNQIRYLIQAGFWIVIVLVGFELFLRLYFSGLKPVYVYDPEWGKRPAAGSVVITRTEGNGIIHYIADGEIRTAYQGGANIPVFGDSHTEAYQVNDDQSFISVAEKDLRAKGINADLRNLAFSGGTLADYAYLAGPVQSKYQPALVVIQISPMDFWGEEGYSSASVANYFTRNADGTLKVIHQPPVPDTSLTMRVLNRFRGFAFSGYSLERVRKIVQNLKNPQGAIADAAAQPLPGDDASPDQRVANYRAQLTALHSAYQGKRVVLVVLPSSPQLYGDQILMEDPEYDLLLDQVKQFKDWQVVDPLPAFQNLWLQEHRLPRGFSNTTPGTGHLNADGHALVGRLLAEKIEEALR